LKAAKPRGKPIRLLIADDSALMRKLMLSIFSAEPDFEVKTAKNGDEALAVLHEFEPDVISLDINMPGTNGLRCLERIMIERPTPVVMFSSMTEEGAAETLEALSLGAVDYMPKPGGVTSLNFGAVAADLVDKIRTAARARVNRSRGLAKRLRERSARPATKKRGSQAASALQLTGEGVVLIGVSTGGPKTLEEILPQLPAAFPWPVVIAQHMPANFTQALAKRMDKLCALQVQEVSRPVALETGNIYIGRGDADIVLRKHGQDIMVAPIPMLPQHVWHPSVDALVESAQTILPPQQIIGVLLTGMGDDGASSMANLHQQGGHTIAESEQSAIVNGMPRELIERNGAEVVLPASEVASQLIAWLMHSQGE
jgi:two-component system chemotaxis response regulator CheB